MRINRTVKILLASIVLSAGVLTLIDVVPAKKAETSPYLLFSEVRMDEEFLTANADLIARVKISGINKRGSEAKTAEGYEAKLSTVELPMISYKAQVIEMLKSENKENQITVILVDSSNNNPFEAGREYLVFLTKNHDGTYTPISYVQGVYEVVDGKTTAQSVLNKDKKIDVRKIHEYQVKSTPY
ncbi:MAG: hypothetical protein KGZ45_08985 [Clostridium sp.]|nr:hypothetical protein [Clostridium sp.]